LRRDPPVTTTRLELIAAAKLNEVGFVPEQVQLEIDACPPILGPLGRTADVDLYPPILIVVNPPRRKPPSRLDERHNVDRQGSLVMRRHPWRADGSEQPHAVAVFVQCVKLE
jgi:hypothetical protein